MNKIEFALRLVHDCSYADLMTEGSKVSMRETITEALEELTKVNENILLVKSSKPTHPGIVEIIRILEEGGDTNGLY